MPQFVGMHLPMINVVCTRATDSNHSALRRWYADHVHLLLTAPELRQAQLYRCQRALAGQPPDYFCIYDFACQDDFLAFEHGQPKAEATELTQAAEGRSSIEIVQRTQYTRWLHRQWAAPAGASEAVGTGWRLAVCLQAEAGWPLEAQRWLADHLQALQSGSPLVEAQVFSGEGPDHPTWLTLDFVGGDAGVIWQMLLAQLTEPSLYGQAQTLKTLWAASAFAQQSWLR